MSNENQTTMLSLMPIYFEVTIQLLLIEGLIWEYQKYHGCINQ